ncbi:MAG: hypothetical protein AAF572_21885 [Cyanobacteria bacterium P01_B01_bin.77]
MKKRIYTVGLIIVLALFGHAGLKMLSNSTSASSSSAVPLGYNDLQAATDVDTTEENISESNDSTVEESASEEPASDTPSIAQKLSALQTREACYGEPVARAMPYNADHLTGRKDIVQVLSTEVKYTQEEKAYASNSDYLKNDLQWVSKGNPALILCVREDPLSELLETCQYEENNKVNRFYGEVELKLVETATGMVVASQSLGKEAAACNPVEIFHSGTEVKSLQVGDFDDVFEAEISEFVRPHVEKFL